MFQFFNIFILHNNSFDNQGSEINKSDIFLRFDILRNFLPAFIYVYIKVGRKYYIYIYIYIYIYTHTRKFAKLTLCLIFTAQHIQTLGLQSDQKSMVNFMWLTTLMPPSSGQNIWSFELNLKILDEVEKRFLSKKFY